MNKIKFGASVLCAISVFFVSTQITTADPFLQSPLQTLLGECYSSSLNLPAPVGLSVNHHALNSTESKNIQWLSKCVLPFMPGTLADRIDNLAKVTWWSLREGILELSNNRVFRYAACNDKNGHDQVTSTRPMYDCETNIWQVGIAAGQAINYTQKEIDEKSKAVIAKLGAAIDQTQLLQWTASLAGFGVGNEFYDQIVNSTARVRRSWFVRNPIIGVLLVKREVDDECLSDGRTWCFSGDYGEAVKFAHTRAMMLKSIEDLRGIYSALQSTTAAAAI